MATIATGIPKSVVRPLPSTDDALRRIVEGTGGAVGEEFFRSLVRHLAGALGMRYALVGEIVRDASTADGNDTASDGPPRVRVLAGWAGNRHTDGFDYVLKGTPCEQAIFTGFCSHPRDVAALFPDDRLLVEMSVQSYMGMPLTDTSGEPLGILAVLHDHPTDGGPDASPASPQTMDIIRIFAGRAAAELQRVRRERDLLRTESLLRQSERRYHALAEKSAVGIWQLGMPDGNTMYVNPAMRRMLELDEQDPAESVRYEDFLTPEGVEKVRTEMMQRRIGRATSYELELTGRKGGRRTVVIYGVPEFGPDGTLLSVVGNVSDITDRLQTENALRASEQRLRMLTRQMPAILWTTDKNLVITSGEGRGISDLGLPEEINFIGTKVTELADTPEWRRGPAIKAHRKALAGESHTYEQVWMDHVYQSHVEPLRSPEGAVVGVIGIAFDITDRKKVENELRDARDFLEFRVAERTDELKKANEALARANEQMRKQIEDRRGVEEELRQSQARYASILNSQQTLIARSDMHGRITYVNAAHQRMFGSHVGDSVYVNVHPDDAGVTKDAMEALQKPPYTTTLEQRVELRGQWRTMLWQVGVIRDRAGKIVEYQGVGFDITDRKRAEELLRESERRAREMADEARRNADKAGRNEKRALESAEEARQVAEFNRRLAREVDHRVRNNLASLMSLVQAMKVNARSHDARNFTLAIEGRLLAMTHVNRLLAETNWKSVELKTLAYTLLEAARQLGCHLIPVHIEGPAVLISARQTPPLAMILLEWFTNSSKYGAHSVDTGNLMVVWSVDRTGIPPWLRLHWTETGGPPIRQKITPSLGTELVEGFATLELKGKLKLGFPEDGADHLLEIPLEQAPLSASQPRN